MPGVVSLRAEPLDGRLIVRYDPSLTTPERLGAAIQEAIDRVDP